MHAWTPDLHASGGVTQAPSTRAPTLVHVVLFFVVTFAFSWALWLPLVLRVSFPGGDDGARLLLALGVAGPTLTAFTITAVASGRRGVHGLWRQATRWRVSPAWYVGVLVGPGVALGAALAVALGLGGGQPPTLALWLPAVVSGLLA